MTDYRVYVLALWLLTALFCLRVTGQALVAFTNISFLPPMEAWYSGFIPYSLLLPVQIGILFLQVKIGMDFTRGSGWITTPRAAMGLILHWFSATYFAAMVLRYILTMIWHSDLRWFGGTIPIVFHWVLAAYVFTLGHYHRYGSRCPQQQKEASPRAC
ncbi:MAG: hypothetical protein ACREI3_02605 [Nitrospirales bacterium]